MERASPRSRSRAQFHGSSLHVLPHPRQARRRFLCAGHALGCTSANTGSDVTLTSGSPPHWAANRPLLPQRDTPSASRPRIRMPVSEDPMAQHAMPPPICPIHQLPAPDSGRGQHRHIP
ncbi:hypothetical protein NDU88_001048 [Pleurodeles waltl]|uniref:Uncharacterized protein n=1 Tax=Pleurodeles waltl TaxID=8319 RepID=A0AAV7LC02_PLEWA|nr:hypothetical protein NDU88_001048 [Pleurodeles waltl]